jgi:predicted O-methyltransferase YrrM
MNKILSKSSISTVDFYSRYEEFMVGSSKDDRTEFFDVCGKQHYRLLSYLSTLVNDAIIIDIGTHHGQSALALSYNKRNIVHTFDIEDRVSNSKIKNVDNINFHMDNLFEVDGREKWNETILKSSFIFLDVDPHNGLMEIVIDCVYIVD